MVKLRTGSDSFFPSYVFVDDVVCVVVGNAVFVVVVVVVGFNVVVVGVDVIGSDSSRNIFWTKLHK